MQSIQCACNIISRSEVERFDCNPACAWALGYHFALPKWARPHTRDASGGPHLGPPMRARATTDLPSTIYVYTSLSELTLYRAGLLLIFRSAHREPLQAE